MPNSLTLLDYSNVVVASDGIHFFGSAFENEEVSKSILLTITKADLTQLCMAQFSSEYEGYILIYIQNNIYIFNSNKILLKSHNFIDSINGAHYCITPYKKENNNLIFIFSYAESLSIILAKCIYNLSMSDSDLTIIKKEIIIQNYNGNNPQTIEGVDCLLMSPLSTFNINNDLLTCFGGMDWEPRIFTATFNPENNLEELVNLRDYKYNPTITYTVYKIINKTDKNKRKALIYIIFNNSPFWTTFDYNNKLSNIYNENLGDYAQLQTECWKHKIFFFEQTSEFIVASGLIDCNIFIMFFNRRNNLYYKGVLYYGEECLGYSNSFTIFYNDNNYIVLFDDNTKSYYKAINEIESITIDNPDINIEDLEFEDSTTFNEIPPTTVTTIYKENDSQISIITTFTEIENPSTNTIIYTQKDSILDNFPVNEKCKKSTAESSYYSLCTECNIEMQYFPALIPDDDFLHGFIECYNNDTKPINFYLDNSDKKYKPCYNKCLTCNEGGNEDNNNCLTCAINFTKNPDYPESNNCVTECFYSYYYTSYGQYKCTNNSYCPKEVNLYIKNLKNVLLIAKMKAIIVFNMQGNA